MGDESPSGWVDDGKRTEYKGHSSDVIADKALDYLNNKRPKDKPFMFFCHFKAPHDTWEFARRYRNILEDLEVPEHVHAEQWEFCLAGTVLLRRWMGDEVFQAGDNFFIPAGLPHSATVHAGYRAMILFNAPDRYKAKG